jgi:hypothetical protein
MTPQHKYNEERKRATEPLTKPEEFTSEMQKIQEECGGDPEYAHPLMDDVMCRVLSEMGYHAGVAIFAKQKKWYA